MATVSSTDVVLLVWVPGRRHPIGIDVVQFTKRLLQDCLTKATGAYWWRRANEFESARPTAG